MFGRTWDEEDADRQAERAELLNKLEEWLREHPGISLILQYVPGGVAMIPGDREVAAYFDPAIGSMAGMSHRTLEELVAAIIRDDP